MFRERCASALIGARPFADQVGRGDRYTCHSSRGTDQHEPPCLFSTTFVTRFRHLWCGKSMNKLFPYVARQNWGFGRVCRGGWSVNCLFIRAKVSLKEVRATSVLRRYRVGGFDGLLRSLCSSAVYILPQDARNPLPPVELAAGAHPDYRRGTV